jgi:hypothetical protein
MSMKHLFQAMTVYVCKMPKAVYLMVLVERANGFVEMILALVESYFPFLLKKHVLVSRTTAPLLMAMVPFFYGHTKIKQHMINCQKK